MEAQGAEGRIYTAEWKGETVLVKERFKKTWRHPVLDDKLTRKRLQQESRMLEKVRKAGIPAPIVHHLDTESNKIYMEILPGPAVVNYLKEKGDTISDAELQSLAKQIGQTIGKLHGLNIVHGDLTTSNMILRDEKELVMIDYGLSGMSSSVEDKAVDLYVLARAISSTHPHLKTFFDGILAEYKEAYPSGSTPVLKKLEDVQARGRKRTAFG